MRPRCVKCLDDHATADCPRPKNKDECTEPPSCVLCGAKGHPANYRGCPKAPKAPPKIARKTTQAVPRSQAPLSIPVRPVVDKRLAPTNAWKTPRTAPQTGTTPRPAFPALRPIAPPPGFEAAPAPSALHTPQLPQTQAPQATPVSSLLASFGVASRAQAVYAMADFSKIGPLVERINYLSAHPEIPNSMAEMLALMHSLNTYLQSLNL